jgi:hypothetical protein
MGRFWTGQRPVKAYLANNPAVSDADRENMGLPLHDTTRTPTLLPSTIPELELDMTSLLHFYDL